MAGRRRPADVAEMLAIALRSGAAGGLLGCVLFFSRRLAAPKHRSKREGQRAGSGRASGRAVEGQWRQWRQWTVVEVGGQP